jgi:hypothetical protein
MGWVARLHMLASLYQRIGKPYRGIFRHVALMA